MPFRPIRNDRFVVPTITKRDFPLLIAPAATQEIRALAPHHRPPVRAVFCKHCSSQFDYERKGDGGIRFGSTLACRNPQCGARRKGGAVRSARRRVQSEWL
jgi:hypothetical protein